MSRFSYYDTDDERLPEGMTRVGYDADTQVYTFQDEDGSLWEGPPGARYGQLTLVSSGPSPSSPHAAPSEPLIVSAPVQHRSWRQELMPLLNFLLLIGVFLLGVFWFMGFSFRPAPPACGGGPSHTVERGDTCWEIAKGRGISLDELQGVNEGLDCNRLRIGDVVCLPRTV